MCGAVRWGSLRDVLVGILCLCLPVVLHAQPADSGEAPVQVFSEVSRTVVAVDMHFTFEVELYASPASTAAAEHVIDAFRTASFDHAFGGLAIVDEEPVQTRTSDIQDDALVLTRRFILRASRPGSHRIPPLRVRLGEASYATATHAIAAYRVERDFFRASASILPIQSEFVDRARHRRYARIGSAFLVTTDAVITSLHVVLNADRVRITLPSGKTLSTRDVWAVDPVRDIAVLAVDRRAIMEAGLEPLPLAPVVGEVALPERKQDVAFTYGWPGGVQRSTAGIRYRGVTLQPGESIWISSNPVRPGDSGGPLLDQHGRVLGVITSGAVYSGRPDALREEVSIALDPRPALALRRQARKPHSLRRLMRDPSFTEDPNVQAIRLTTLLTSGFRRIPDLDETLARLDGASMQAPDDARLHFLRGLIYHLLGTARDAADAYRTSLDAYDGHFLAAYMLGTYHMHRREYATAEQFFRQARKYAPAVHIAAYGLARALMGRLRYDDAVPLLHSVVAHDPSYAPAYFDLALCALAQDDEPRARQLLEKLETLNPVSARRLRRVLHNPVLQPHVLDELPRVDVSLLGASL